MLVLLTVAIFVFDDCQVTALVVALVGVTVAFNCNVFPFSILAFALFNVILVAYAVPIVILVLTILVGQSVLGSMGFLLSGQTLRNSMRCGFSMAQIGEFAFIIASLGLSLHVIGNFLYPVVAAETGF